MRATSCVKETINATSGSTSIAQRRANFASAPRKRMTTAGTPGSSGRCRTRGLWQLTRTLCTSDKEREATARRREKSWIRWLEPRTAIQLLLLLILMVKALHDLLGSEIKVPSTSPFHPIPNLGQCGRLISNGIFFLRRFLAPAVGIGYFSG